MIFHQKLAMGACAAVFSACVGTQSVFPVFDSSASGSGAGKAAAINRQPTSNSISTQGIDIDIPDLDVLLSYNAMSSRKQVVIQPRSAYNKTQRRHSGIQSLTLNAPVFNEKPYAYLVNNISRYLNVPASLIHAVIDAESNYQPKAVSYAGAVGLMQLVPKFGGREAYYYLYGRDRVPTRQALKRPKVNVLLGTAYLLILDEQYFDWIKNQRVRLRAVIAAYNWGPTAVMNQLFRSKHIQGVEQFMAKLDARAPEQTRVYVRRVINNYHANRQIVLASISDIM